MTECAIPEIRESNIERLATLEEIERCELEKTTKKYNI